MLKSEQEDVISTDSSDYSDVELLSQSDSESIDEITTDTINVSASESINNENINHDHNMTDNINLNVKTWNCLQVKNWLKSKGMSDEIQNKFYNEEIDGEALLYLNENNIDKLTEKANSSIGSKIKLKQYIKVIQNSTHSVNYLFDKNNNIFVNDHASTANESESRYLSVKNEPLDNNVNNIKLEPFTNHNYNNKNNNKNNNNEINDQFIGLYNKLFNNNHPQTLKILSANTLPIKLEESLTKSPTIKQEKPIKTEPSSSNLVKVDKSQTKLSKKSKCKTNWRKYYKYKKKKYIKPIKCTKCNDTFIYHTNFKTHMNNIHNVDKPYICKVCPASKSMKYTSKYGLKLHIQREHEKIEKSFFCELCPRAFYDKQNHAIHQRVHDGKKPFKCNYCKKRFGHKSSLKQHINTIHLKQRNYKCSDCEKAFGSSTNMKKHMVAIHNSQIHARFQCNVCQKRFYTRRLYLKHKQTAHKPKPKKDKIKEMIKSGVCPYKKCKKRYNSKSCISSVKYHLVNTHNDRKYANYECKKCEKIFYCKTAYTKHMIKH